MDTNTKNEIILNITARITVGLDFIESNYLRISKRPDTAWIRNIYILLSFYTELLLKAIFIYYGIFSDVIDLDKKLRRTGHDLEKIGKKIGKKKLANLNITDIKGIKDKNGIFNVEYSISSKYGGFNVKDFIDIRYDFIEGKVRNVDNNENEKFKSQIDIIMKINKHLERLIPL